MMTNLFMPGAVLASLKKYGVAKERTSLSSSCDAQEAELSARPVVF
jgi:hypothetical protein